MKTRDYEELAQSEISFFVDCIPPTGTHQSTQRIFKSKKGYFYRGHNARGASIAKKLWVLLTPYKPKTPFVGAVQVEVDFIFPWRANEPKKNQLNGDMPKDTKPDADNLLKFFLDAMENSGYFQTGDSQVSKICVGKYWGTRTGIRVTISSLI